jgi:two-component system C4-dicarboxylate transport response regulator DctD
MTHNWPGNVRELRNVVERYVLGLTGETRAISTLIQPAVRQPLTLGAQVDDLERLIIEQSLAEHKGNIQATVDALGTPRRTLNQKMRKYGLDRKDYR